MVLKSLLGSTENFWNFVKRKGFIFNGLHVLSINNNHTSQKEIKSNLYFGCCPDFFWPEAAEFFDLCYQSTVHGDAKILQMEALFKTQPD